MSYTKVQQTFRKSILKQYGDFHAGEVLPFLFCGFVFAIYLQPIAMPTKAAKHVVLM